MACKDCASGMLHDGTPTGRVETMFGLPTYISEPPEGSTPIGIVVILPDAFGWNLPNPRLLADAYAKKGNFKVLLPDFMNGNNMSHATLGSLDTLMGNASIFEKFLPSLQTIIAIVPFLFYNRLSITHPRVFTFFTSLRTSTTLPIGCAGFCWGGKFVALLCADTVKTPSPKPRSLVDCGFTAHPGNLVIPGDIEAVKMPLSICNGTEDIVMEPEQAMVVKRILDGKGEGRHEVVILEGAKHGFAVRGHPGVEEEARLRLVAEDQAVSWFRRWLGGGKA